MEHLELEIFDLPTADNPRPSTSQFATLPDDTTITITDTSEVFASGDVWSYSFTLNVKANAHILGSVGDLHGSRLHEVLNKRRARLWVEEIALYMGYLKLDNEAEVDEEGNIDVKFESGQKTFDQLIDGGKANQVPMFSDVPIGMALWRKRWVRYTMKLQMWLSVKTTGDDVAYSVPFPYIFECDGENDENSTQEYPRMVYPRGEFLNRETWLTEHINCLNTDRPYDEDENGVPLIPFCNTALCYQKQDYLRKNENGVEYEDYSSSPEPVRGYEYMPADRVNSAPNFYVIYWLRCLMKHIGIHIEENQMMDVEDLRRLFFVNTKCNYKVPKYMRKAGITYPYGKYSYVDYHRRLIAEQIDVRSLVRPDECLLKSDDFEGVFDDLPTFIINPDNATLTAHVVEVHDLTEDEQQEYIDKNNLLHWAYAKSDCFPDVDISEAIKAIENVAGVRFLFSDDYKRVRIVLLRNIFRSKEVQDIKCDVIKDVKTDNNIRGFRLTYGNTEDTHFYYKGFADMLPHKKKLWQEKTDEHDYSHWDLNAVYSEIINKVTAFNKTCYVTPDTGNAYGVKVDKNAKRYEELHPSMFEFAGFMDAEDGDCTGEEDTIKTIEMGFTPAIMNDLNMEEERNKDLTDDQRKQRFALFVEETMRPRRPDLKDGQDYNDPTAEYSIQRLYAEDSPASRMRGDDGVIKPGEFCIASDSYAEIKNYEGDLYFKPKFIHPMHLKCSAKGHINEGYRLYLQDNFEPNDDGISPIENHDWGLTLGIMRGSGSDAGVKYWPDPSDYEGNDTWEVMAGSSVTMHPDTCDSYGREWDYNGEQSGIGPDGRMSLKLRAEKLNPYFDKDLPESATNQRYLTISNERLRQRGIADTCYKELSYWERNARCTERTVSMGIAQLQTLDKTKKARVGDVTGFIRKISFTVSKQTGLGNVTLEILYI